LFAYLDARVAFPASGEQSALPAPLLVSLGKREQGAAIRAELTKPALDLALRSAFGH
jgi:hypothetical protein